jgi:cyclophilin family peptidyl-prolyl cis-trans isomerase
MFQNLKNFLFFLVISQPLYADVLVRMEVQQDAATDSLYLRLFDGVVQDTVLNFLNYVNDGDYNNSFIHRSDPGFVIQGGGFTFDPALNDGTFSYDLVNDVYPGGLQPVPTDPPIQNEFNLSNLRGTIAMAKLGGDPDSATSQWFINLADNSSILDGQNGGFTVFGEVISNGMTVVDGIAGLPVYQRNLDIHPAFAELPLINYIADPILQQNLVRVNSVTELLSISADINFKAVINTSTQSVITIKNTDTISHSIGDIASTDTIDAPFSIIANTCSNTTLAQDAECTLSIQFSPQSEGIFNDTFNIELTDLALSYSFSLTGQGGATVQDIAPSFEAVEFAEVQLYDPSNPLSYEQIVVFINNDGGLDLEIFSMSLDGADAADFEIFENCVDFSPVVPGGYCVLPVNFKPLTVGEKSATITITSDDPDENPLVIPVSGTASIDTDGVPVSVEDAAPNGGDGNNDGVLDSIQNNVASFPGINGAYITLITSTGTRISNISVLSNDQLVSPPDNIQFNLGVLDFKLEDLRIDGTAEVGVILPPGYVASTYYMYGATPDNINPHWYEFMYDGTTGAQLIGKAVLTSPDGTRIERHLIKLFFKDGERGDADLSENGVIIDPGAPVVSLEDSGSGSMNFWLLLYLTTIFILLRMRYVQS